MASVRGAEILRLRISDVKAALDVGSIILLKDQVQAAPNRTRLNLEHFESPCPDSGHGFRYKYFLTRCNHFRAKPERLSM